LFAISTSHHTKWSQELGRAQPISLVPINRGSLSGKNVFTMGSCFALEIRHQFAERGYATFPRYFDIEFDPDQAMLSKLPELDDFSHFSIASILQEFENILAPRPLLSPEYFFDLSLDDSVKRQIRLFLRSVRRTLRGQESPKFDAKWQDPFRKHIFAKDFDTIRSVSTAITEKIREGAEKADLFIFTLGMTEVWLEKKSKLAVCNSYGGRVDELLCEFKDLSLAETLEKTTKLVETVRQINPRSDIVLTVSPIPLQRTSKNESIVTANTASKAKQRAAAAEVCSRFENVFYFPSFELAQDDDFYESDGRHVTRNKVNYIVDNFLRWYQGR
jgi:hypothetical protein